MMAHMAMSSVVWRRHFRDPELSPFMHHLNPQVTYNNANVYPKEASGRMGGMGKGMGENGRRSGAI